MSAAPAADRATRRCSFVCRMKATLLPFPAPLLLLSVCLLLSSLLSPARSEGAPVEILAAGDVVPTARMAEGGLSTRLFSQQARRRIEQARLFIWNCETSGISSRSKPNAYTFHADATFFSQMYFPNGVAVTANNHVFDGYEEGAGALIRILDENAIRHNGLHVRHEYRPLLTTPWTKPDIYLMTGSPMSQIGGGPRIVTLSYPALREEISGLRARKPSAIIIVYAHDGLEYQDSPTLRQKQWARIFARAGADVVLFAHNHRYGEFQILEDTPRKTFVAWSLGNFLFGGNRQWRCHRDVRLLSLRLDPDSGHKEGRWLYGRTRDWEFSLLDEELPAQPPLQTPG